MTVTYPKIMFGLYALELKLDSIPSTTSPLQPFSKIGDLKTNNATGLPFASYEQDYWLLNGKHKFIPSNYTNVHVGIISKEMSGSNGLFVTQPMLTITFGSAQDIDGVSMTFAQMSDDYASNLSIAYYDAANGLITSQSYSPASFTFSTNTPVAAVKRLDIVFYSTNKPYRYLRLTNIDFGELLTLDRTSIKEAQAIEQINVISTELPYGTLDITLLSDEKDFDITNPQGFYQSLSQRQPIACYEYVDGQLVNIGQYYLDSWENQSETMMEFRCVDTLGVLDTVMYMGGIWPTGINLKTLLDSMFTPINIPYELDSQLASATVKGWLPISSYRETLQHIGMAVGAVITSARYGGIQIYKAPDLLVDVAIGELDKTDLSLDTRLKLKAMITGVEIVGHNYVENTVSQDLVKETLPVGIRKVEFAQPMHGLTIAGATITESGANYAIINVASAGLVELTGKDYIETVSIFSKTTSGLPSTIKPNIVRIDQAYLVNSDNGATVRDRVYQYFQYRYFQETKLFSPVERTGAIITMPTVKGKNIKTVIERMDMNLSGGFVVAVEATGVLE